MKKSWEHTLRVDAPVEHVFGVVADIERHPEWDKFTKKVELLHAGDGQGVGAAWKIYEQMGLFAVGVTDQDPRRLTGLAKREVTAVEANRRVAWHTHPIPRMGVSADVTYEFAAAGGGTDVTFRMEIEAPGLMQKLTEIVARNVDERQQTQWKAALEGLKAYAEAKKPAMAGV